MALQWRSSGGVRGRSPAVSLLDEAVEDHLPLPQRTLAAMPAVHRQSSNRVLKNLAQRAIAVAYADIQILDSDALAWVVAGPGR